MANKFSRGDIVIPKKGRISSNGLRFANGNVTEMKVIKGSHKKWWGDRHDSLEVEITEGKLKSPARQAIYADSVELSKSQSLDGYSLFYT
jgi:hypothetical protein